MREWIVPLTLGGKEVGELRVIARTPVDALLKAHQELSTVRVSGARTAPAPTQAA